MTGHDIQRFFDKIDITDTCWNWTAYKNKWGYGEFRYDDRMTGAHRFSYMAFVDNIPDGLLVCHHCDNPGCVNPSHLFVGTNKDNSDDKFKKNRFVKVFQKGESHGLHKLTEQDVKEIRDRYIPWKVTQRQLAEEYGVTQTVIGDVIRGVSWSHVI